MWRPFALAVLSASGTLPAAAQEPPTQAAVLGEQTVTGSRIGQSDNASFSSLTVMTRENIVASGRDSVGRALQDLPAVTGSPMNTNVNLGGDGSTRIDLRGLGSERTLVLLNGRRFVGDAAGVDLNAIPVSLVERVEVLADGASPVYGSDAIAGVTNIITRKDYEGADVAVRWSQTTHGDGEILTASVSGGMSGQRWNLAGGLDWTDTSAVYGGARTYSESKQTLICADDPENPVPHCPTEAINIGSPTIPQGTFLLPEGTPFGPGGFYTLDAQTNQYRPAVFDFVADNDFYNIGAVSYLQTPNERGQLWLQGHYDLAGDLQLFGEGLYYRRDSEQLVAPLPYLTLFFPGAPLTGIGNPDAAGLTGVDARNFYNPFGVDLFDVRRRMVEVGGRRFTQEVETWRVVGGMNGNFRGWYWETALNWGKNTQASREFGQFLGEPLALALGPSGRDAPGSPRIVCGVPVNGVVPAANVIPGCVPIDLFHGVGTITPEMVDDLKLNLTDYAGNEQRDLLAYTSGELFDLPAGPLALSAGVEYRKELGYSHPDAARRPGGSTGEVETSTDGSFNVKEIYFEASVPLLGGVKLAERLEISFGGRYTDVSTSGSNTSFMGGLQWRPVHDLLLRARYAQVFRAPGINDLFQGQVDVQFDSVVDPCSGHSGDPGYPGCSGLPPGYAPEFVGPVVRFGGNPLLQPEDGETITFGLSYNPAGLPGFSASIDHFDVRLARALGKPDFEHLLERCAITNDPSICSLVERHPVTGEPVGISAVIRNLGDMEASGVDLELLYDTTAALGRVDFDLIATYLDLRQTRQFPGEPATPLAGTYAFGQAFPRWRALGRVNWSAGVWSAEYRVNYIDGYHEYDTNDDLLAPDSHGYSRDVASRLYHNLSCTHSFATGTQLSLAVYNVTDQQPPRVNAGSYANTDPATYDLLGRQYLIRLQQEFR